MQMVVGLGPMCLEHGHICHAQHVCACSIPRDTELWVKVPIAPWEDLKCHKLLEIQKPRLHGLKTGTEFIELGPSWLSGGLDGAWCSL